MWLSFYGLKLVLFSTSASFKTLDFICCSFNPDPTVRNTFWTLSIGGMFSAMPAWTVSQAAVQRFLASESVKTAQRFVYCTFVQFARHDNPFIPYC